MSAKLPLPFPTRPCFGCGTHIPLRAIFCPPCVERYVGEQPLPDMMLTPSRWETRKQKFKEHAITTVIVAVVTLLLLPVFAKCEDVDVAKPVALYAGLSVADVASTRWARANGASEGNPAMRTGLEWKRAAQAGALTGLDLLLQRQDPRLARALRRVAVAVTAFVVGVNVANATSRGR